MKKIISIICIISSVLAVLFLFTGCYNEPSLKDYDFDSLYSKNYSEVENDAEFYSNHYSMEYLEHLSKRKIKDLEKQTIEFFKTTYNVDVTEKLEKLETYLFRNSDYNDTRLGCYIPGEDKVFINRNLYRHETEYFAYAWCHEVIHYLGITFTDTSYTYLYETVAESVNLQLLEWMNKPYYPDTLYLNAVDVIGNQLISTNPELISTLLQDDNFYLEDHLNEILENANFDEFQLTENATISEQINTYLVSLIEQQQNFEEPDESITEALQEIIITYCEHFNFVEATN